MSATPDHGPAGTGVDGARRGPLSPEQLGVWLHDEMAPDEPRYVEPICFVTEQPVDLDRLVQAVGRALRRHPAFGAGLDLADGLPQLVLDRYAIVPQRGRYPDAPALDAEVRARARQAFDTAGEPLTRCAVLTDGRRTVLLLVWHHLVVDALSLRLFLADVADCYRDPDATPAPVTTTICDLARRRLDWTDSAAGHGAVKTALARLGDAPALTSRPRPRVVVERPVPVAPAVLARAAAATGGTVTEVACTAYLRELARLLAVEDLVVGVAATTRSEADEFDVAGYAVNTVLVRGWRLADRDWPAAVEEVRYALREAVAEQAPFRDVVRALVTAGTVPGAYPTCYLDSFEEPDLVLGDVTWQPWPIPRSANRFPICLTLRRRSDGLSVLVEAETDLLDRTRAVALADAVTARLARVAG